MKKKNIYRKRDVVIFPWFNSPGTKLLNSKQNKIPSLKAICKVLF